MNNTTKSTKEKNPEAIEVLDKQIIPHQNGVVESDYNIDGFLEKRAEFITKVNKIMVEGKDYHVIQGKKSLAKGGAEKIASIFNWSAIFEKDDETWEMLGRPVGTLCYVCNVGHVNFVAGENFKGQGRGAANLDKNAKDPNKTIKMAQKSAFIDAVLRASGLSDFFTQDLEDMPKEQIGDNSKVVKEEKIASAKQLEFIKTLMKDKGIEKLSDIGFNPTSNGKMITMVYAKEIIDALLKLERKEPEMDLHDPNKETVEEYNARYHKTMKGRPYIPNKEGD